MVDIPLRLRCGNTETPAICEPNPFLPEKPELTHIRRALARRVSTAVYMGGKGVKRRIYTAKMENDPAHRTVCGSNRDAVEARNREA
jgi:hypothetical protein